MIELQAHSTVSDGELAPRAVVEAAASAGVTVLALTDHDAVDGVREAAAAAADAGTQLVAAVELSSVFEGHEDLHICGYGIDTARIESACARAREERVARARAIVERLQAAGVDVTFERVVAAAGDGTSIGRPHIARAAGAVDLNDFFARYLVPGHRRSSAAAGRPPKRRSRSSVTPAASPCSHIRSGTSTIPPRSNR
jgi:predicted metal-dependent phosphoesterase TrpH